MVHDINDDSETRLIKKHHNQLTRALISELEEEIQEYLPAWQVRVSYVHPVHQRRKRVCLPE